jgi:hypothetical protein
LAHRVFIAEVREVGCKRIGGDCAEREEFETQLLLALEVAVALARRRKSIARKTAVMSEIFCCLI